MDRDPKHLQAMILRAHQHKGSSFLEIYQNCNIFNDGAFEIFTEKKSKPEEALFLEQGKPLLFGAAKNKGIKLDGLKPVVVEMDNGISENDLWIHDEKDFYKARFLQEYLIDPQIEGSFSATIWGFLSNTKEPAMKMLWLCKLKKPLQQKEKEILDKILKGRETWSIN